MFRLALLFMVIALVAAMFGFGGVADIQYAAAQVIFYLFMILAVIAGLTQAFNGH